MKNEKKRRYTKKEGLFLPVRQASMLMVGMVVCATILFMGGYFVGKKHTLEQLVMQVETDSFADQLYASMCTLYDAGTDDTSTLLAMGDEEDTRWTREKAEEEEAEETAAEEADGEFALSDQAPTYVGQLLSYHVREYADNFVQKMARKKLSLEVRTRTSVTTSGDEKSWYQVVTKPFTDRHELEVVVEQLSQEEKITGAQIIVC